MSHIITNLRNPNLCFECPDDHPHQPEWGLPEETRTFPSAAEAAVYLGTLDPRNAERATLSEDGCTVTLAAEYSRVPKTVTAADKAAKRDMVWAAAGAYENQYGWNGNGIAVMTLGIIAKNEQALANMAWNQTMWADAVGRWDACTAATTFAELDAVSVDFSSHGAKPYTIDAVAKALGLLPEQTG